MTHGPWLLAAGLVGAYLLRGSRTLAKLDAKVLSTIKARLESKGAAWLGQTEQSAKVRALITDYATAWQWAEAPDFDQGAPDWCGIWAMEVIREALGLPPWPTMLYQAPLPLHPWGRWYGSVGDIIKVAEGKGFEVQSPAPGDLYSIGTTHVGLVRSVEDNRIVTFDANWSNEVGSRTTGTADKRFWRWLQT